MSQDAFPAGNFYDKYHTGNPLYKFAVRRFLRTLDDALVVAGGVENILEVGCGEGFLLGRLGESKRYMRLEGIDVSKEVIMRAQTVYPFLKFLVGSVCNLNYREGEFDLVLACEVLEHIGNADKALSEIRRVTNKFTIISVPVEPLWRFLNLARGAYFFSLGNTPGHVNHWSTNSFHRLLRKHFSVKKTWYPLPWQIALCSKF